MTTNYSNVPDFVERKGSLFLRSDHMNYSRATLNSNWHQARESEPKDYDLSKDQQRDLCKASYDRIGNVTDGYLPDTTYQAFSEQVYNKAEFTEQEPVKHMINTQTCDHMNLDREMETPQKGFGSVLPHHHPDHNKHHFETTNGSDFKAPYPYTPADETMSQREDHTSAYKRCNSQFTDTADYRRGGRNTWHDESGTYTNSHLKAQAPPYKRTSTTTQVL